MAEALIGWSAKADPNPIVIPRLAVAVYGGTQPDKLARLLREGDDGLLRRLLWLCPEPIPFRLGHQTPRVEWAIRALDRLRSTCSWAIRRCQSGCR
jgi:hypothetical protein